MRTETKKVSVETIVKKYHTFVQDKFGKDYGWYFKNDEDFAYDHRKYSVVQLIVRVYKAVAGEYAEKKVLDLLSSYLNHYYVDAIEESEFDYLCKHFKIFIEYVFVKRDELGFNSHNLEYKNGFEIEFIKSHIHPKPNSNIFIACVGYCDVAVMFPDCNIKGITGPYMEEVWALGQIRLFAHGIHAQIDPGKLRDEDETKWMYVFDDSLASDADYVLFLQSGHARIGIQPILDRMPNNGCFFYFDYDALWEKDNLFLERAVKGNNLASIISHDISLNSSTVLRISKVKHDQVEVSELSHGASKNIPVEDIDSTILCAGYYLSNRKKDGIKLSSVVSCYETDYQKDNYIKDDDIDKIQGVIKGEKANALVLRESDLNDSYRDSNLEEKRLIQASDPSFVFEACKNSEGVKKWNNLNYQSIVRQPFICICCKHGEREIKLGYFESVESMGIGVIPNMGFDSVVLLPKPGYDIKYVAALLLSPEVKEQIMLFCNGSLFNVSFEHFYDRIMIPYHNEKERLDFLSKANYEAYLETKRELRKNQEDYRKSVRMRKHALTQSFASMKAMFMALNSYRNNNEGRLSDNELISKTRGVTVAEGFEFLFKGFENLSIGLEHIADVEYSFQKPEWLDPVRFIIDYYKANHSGWVNFICRSTWKSNNISKNNVYDDKRNRLIVKKNDPMDTFYFPKDALELIMNNIVSNAISHGFTDKKRNDYELRFSWHTEGTSLIIEIENNGTPIPADRDLATLKEYGVSTALHQNGHNGIGCNEIDDIMHRYDGDFEIISTPQEEFTVKYVLSFTRTNILSNYHKAYET